MRASTERRLVGSAVLLLVVALLVLRPWEAGRAIGGAGPPAPGADVVAGDRRRHDRSRGSAASVEDVRLIGVDTPETVKPGHPGAVLRPARLDFNHRLLEGTTVRLVFGVERRDVYGRLLAYVYLGRRLRQRDPGPPRASPAR